MTVQFENRPLASAFWRPVYLALGLLFVIMGFIGVFVPVWPTTIFLIMAVWAFKRSSPPLEQWLLNHRVLGPTLRDWDETRSIRRRTKIVAISAIWVCLAISAWLTHKPLMYAVLAVVGVSLTVYLWTRKTKPG